MKNRISEVENRDSVIEECRKEDGQVILVRDNQSECVLDFEQSTIHFDDYDRFVQFGYTDALVNMIWRHETFQDGTPKYLMRSRDSFNRSGYPITLNLADYGIEMIRQDTKYYVPVQTLSDILLTEMTNFVIYNGTDLFINDMKMNTDPEDPFNQSLPKGMRSTELCTFNYNEFALAMDFNYGQKEEQNITDFRSYMKSLGLEEPLLSEDPAVSAPAFAELMIQNLGSAHNSIEGPTCYLEDVDSYDERMGDFKPHYDRIAENYHIYMNAREQLYDEPGTYVPRYEEVGDTAILTFDGFDFADNGTDYYEKTVSVEDLGNCYHGIDTIGLIQYAHKQITRPDSPIENVVIDLTNNTGGDVDAGAFLLAWIMGSAPISLRNRTTGAETTSYYQCDANFDGVYDENDNLKSCGKKGYCLTSMRSFSCANMVPNILKETHSAVLLGETSGGGSCAVLPLCTADGTIVGISGKLEICTVNNGIYYGVDQGVIPDVTITDLATLYNRQKLVDTIHSLY